MKCCLEEEKLKADVPVCLILASLADSAALPHGGFPQRLEAAGMGVDNRHRLMSRYIWLELRGPRHAREGQARSANLTNLLTK